MRLDALHEMLNAPLEALDDLLARRVACDPQFMLDPQLVLGAQEVVDRTPVVLAGQLALAFDDEPVQMSLPIVA